MATYAVNMSNVQEVAAQMQVLSQYISRVLDQLNTDTMASLAEWDAVSRGKYEEARTNWTNAAADMAMQATQAHNALTSIHDAYANAEYQGLGLWG